MDGRRFSCSTIRRCAAPSTALNFDDLKGRIAVVGPTASGKTALAIQIAKAYGGELINADSRQVLSNVSVGTGKPTAAELDGVRCHCLDLWQVGETYTVADWLDAARAADDEIQRHDRLSVLVGGTGLYVISFVDGFRETAAVGTNSGRDARNRMVEQGRLAELAAELTSRDPEGAAGVDLDNPRRVIRALELLDEGWNRLGDATKREDPRPALILGLNPRGEAYRQTVKARVNVMFAEQDLVGEVRALKAGGISDELIARCAIGYAEALDVLAGTSSQTDAVEATVRRTLKYAKAQRTWWSRDPRVVWAAPGPDTKQTFA
jgi:tRNA dimethylallyltransferase